MKDEIHKLLDQKVKQYNHIEFIGKDPICIAHLFTKQKDIEIAGFFAAIFAWGNRTTIINKSKELLERMDNAPYDFVMSAGKEDLNKFSRFIHRTFNGKDCIYFIKSLKEIYSRYESMEDLIVEGKNNNGTLKSGISFLRNSFFYLPHELRTEKHFADVMSGAAGKRLNMFLRWMVRRDNRGVDFGIWKRISPSELYIPLDLHSGNTARRLGLLKRKLNDWKAVEELTEVLRGFDPGDPVKYDFALFGSGVNEKF